MHDSTDPMYDTSALSILTAAADSLRRAEESHGEQQEDEAHIDAGVGTEENVSSPPPEPAAAAAAAKPIPPPNRTRAEQLRREALDESLNDYLPIENLRAVERMNEKELKESKNLLMCFLSGRAPQDDPAQNSKNRLSPKEYKNIRYVRNYQHDLSNLSRPYHYTYDPSMPLPISLADRRPQLEKKHAPTHKPRYVKNKKQKTQSKKNEDELLTKIEDKPLLLWTPHEPQAIEEEAALHGAKLVSKVPAIVNVQPGDSTEHMLDESVHSSVVAEEAPNPVSYSFEYNRNKRGWECKQCCTVHPTFQAAHAFIGISSGPDHRLMHLHRQACLGMKAHLAAALHVVLNLTKTSSIKFKHIISAEFQSVVRIAVNGNEEYVTLFTTDLRNRWLDPTKHILPSANIDWSQYPVKAPQAESGQELIGALVLFAKKMGLGFDFVGNESFVELFRMISPQCCLPTSDDLISCW